MNDKYYTKEEAYNRLGISIKKFNTLELIPDKIEQNLYCTSKFMYKYDRKKIDSLYYSPTVVELRKRKKKTQN